MERKLYDTDKTMLGIYHWLTQDFRSTEGLAFCQDLSNALSQGIPAFRSRPQDSYFLSTYSYFKRRYQLESLFKRYRFASDLYTDAELQESTNEKFLATQMRIGQKRPVPLRAFKVLQKARTIIKAILGSYDCGEHVRACKFGAKADVGNTARDSYLDTKLSTPLTGSSEHIEWFKTHLPSDEILSDLLHKCSPVRVPVYQVCEELTMTNVPKTYKALRSIMPNTRLGVFYTYGLGRVLQDRLKESGLDIRRLQELHGIMAKRYSVTKSHVTADLSAASDSFCTELIMRLLPRKWFHAVKLGRLSHCRVGEQRIQLQSFMTMGIGFTFQLQTLLFYGILKAISELSGIKGRISVYGDDLIYPTRMHHYVRTIFQDVNFLLNDDKTFVRQDFRESCGSDYYCGIDVRPFQPEGRHTLLSSKMYALFLYKAYNGLKRRWEEEEITQTLRYLLSEILRVESVILQVPPSFPDYSGIRTDVVKRNDWMLPWYEITHDGNRSICFAFYRLFPRDRVVIHQYAYYWDSLRASSSDDQEPPVDEFGTRLDPFSVFTKTPLVTERTFNFTPRERLRWKVIKNHPSKYRSKWTGKRLQKLVPVVAEKMGLERPERQLTSIPFWS